MRHWNWYRGYLCHYYYKYLKSSECSTSLRPAAHANVFAHRMRKNDSKVCLPPDRWHGIFQWIFLYFYIDISAGSERRNTLFTANFIHSRLKRLFTAFYTFHCQPFVYVDCRRRCFAHEYMVNRMGMCVRAWCGLRTMHVHFAIVLCASLLRNCASANAKQNQKGIFLFCYISRTHRSSHIVHNACFTLARIHTHDTHPHRPN